MDRRSAIACTIDPRRLLRFSLWFLIVLAPGVLVAQDGSIHTMVRGGGGYLSLLKLSLIAIAFLIWVPVVDWVNRDAMKIGRETGLQPEVWNPINTGTFLLGFLAAITIPVFLAGYPVYLLAAFTSPMIYALVRRSKIKADAGLALKARAKPNEVAQLPVLPQDEGPPIEFVPAGNEDQRQVNLIRARQTPEEGFMKAKSLIDQCVTRRADFVLMDYSKDQAAVRMQIDGSWHPLPTLDRFSGDAILATLKYLAGLNPADRRSRQTGQFRVILPYVKCSLEVSSHGTPTGERVQLKFTRDVKNRMSIHQLGMWPEMSAELAKHLNSHGLVIISSLPGQGLTSTWQAVLEHTDRITRDCIALVDMSDTETEVENIAVNHFDKELGQSPASILKRLLLAQPDCLIVPDVVNSQSLDLLTHEAVKNNRAVITRIHAKSAADALLRMYSLSKDRRQFAEAVSAVTNQRLLRRLCDTCKTEVQVQPKMIQQLGGDPRQQNTLFAQYRLPPPEQRVDAKGRPIEFPPCETCGGIGYIGRIAAFETIFVTDPVRQCLFKQPTPDAIEQAARAEGKLSLTMQAYKLVLNGLTTLQEVQRVMKAT
jgi:type II secretory ATPase GspE/PulE/Tfp pilus assembly ATPase PilB-like protein